MARYAVVDGGGKSVRNVIRKDPATPHDPGPGATLVLVLDGVRVSPGDTYDARTQTFTPAPADPAPAEQAAAKRAALAKIRQTCGLTAAESRALLGDG